MVVSNMSYTSGGTIGISVFSPVASTLISFGIVITGGVLSVMVIYCDLVSSFPFSSTAFHFTSVLPTVNSSGALFVTSTRNMSVAVAFPMFNLTYLLGASRVISSGIVN